jgi:hypothetical protein
MGVGMVDRSSVSTFFSKTPFHPREDGIGTPYPAFSGKSQVRKLPTTQRRRMFVIQT